MSTNIEQVAISKIIDHEELLPFLEANITSSFFQQERWLKAWTWVREYWAEHGAVPTPSAFKRQFPAYKLCDAEEPTSAIISELIAARRYVLVKDGMTEAVGLFEESVDDTVAALARLLASVNAETSRSDVKRTDEIIRSVVEAASTPKFGLVGIPYGFPTIDEATGGMQPENLISIIALPKSGKSTISLQIAINAQRQEKKGGLITFEMSNDEVLNRYLSLGAEINLNSILRGPMSEEEKAKLDAFADEVENLPPLSLIYDRSSTMTVGGIAAKIEQIGDLDFIVVDGAYLMEDEQGQPSGSAQALTNITRSLKRLAQQKKMTIILTTQALIQRTSRRNGVQLGSIGYTSSFAQDSDAIIGLDREDLSQPTAKLKVIAARNSLGVETNLIFDYYQGLIMESGGGGYTRTDKTGYASDDGD